MMNTITNKNKVEKGNSMNNNNNNNNNKQQLTIVDATGCERPTSNESLESLEFFHIDGDINTKEADPRKFKGFFSKYVRIQNLKLIDGKQWHYTTMAFMVLDFCLEILSIMFTSSNLKIKINTFSSSSSSSSSSYHHPTLLTQLAFYFSCGVFLLYVIDMILRICSLRLALLRSQSTIADLCCFVGLMGLILSRYLYPRLEYHLSIIYTLILSIRIILKPRARSFSKKLHGFSSNQHGNKIRVSMEAVRLALRRIPGVSAIAVEMMETDLVIICGRDEGDINCNELMEFIEKALLYRPRELSATEFLSYLQDIGAMSTEYAYGAFDVIKSTLKHWATQKSDMIWSFFWVCINAGVIPAQAFFIKQVTDNALNVAKGINKTMDNKDTISSLQLGVIGILTLCIPFVTGNIAIGYFQSKMISKATQKLQHSLLDIILSQETNFFVERAEGDLNNLFGSDIARVNALWQSVFWNLLNPFVSVVFGFSFILIQDWSTGFIAFAFTAVLLSSGPQQYAAMKSKEFGSKNAYITAEFQNAISCQKVIRAYSIRQPFMERFDQTLASLRYSAFLKDFWASIVQIYVESAMYVFVAIVTASLAIKTSRGEIEPGTFFSFVTLLGRISQPVAVLGGFMRVAIGNASSLQRLDDIIWTLGDQRHDDSSNYQRNNPTTNNRRGHVPKLSQLSCAIEVKNLYFKYDKTNPSDYFVLNNLSITIPKGTYVGVCGPSGSGKSTLLGCLMQFYEPDYGSILMDGNDIKQYPKSSFMKQTAVVFQEIMILNETILENIRYGNCDATDDDCIEAAKLAECTFIGNLRDGFNTIIGQHATCSLSGGQAQRVCLARALCRKPKILLLDEATSSLDSETEASIIRTLEKLRNLCEMTIVSVTHRLHSLLNADMIVVLNQGCVVETGTYRSLTNTSTSLFSEMIQSEKQENKTEKKNRLYVSGDNRMNRLSSALRSSSVLYDGKESPIQTMHKTLIEQFSLQLTARAGPEMKGIGTNDENERIYELSNVNSTTTNNIYNSNNLVSDSLEYYENVSTPNHQQEMNNKEYLIL